MGNLTYVLGLLCIASLISSFASEVSVERSVRKSSLILEYNWPEPSKSLERLPHPRSCHHFIHTKRDGRHVVKRCHGDKMFDYRSLRCQHKSSAKCWINIVKKGNIKKIKRSFSCPFPWGLYPDKEDCSMFYDCMGGKVYPRKCPDSTLFDVVERICVHSRKALCARDSDFNTNERITSYSHLLINPRANKEKNSWANRNRISTTISSKSSGTFGLDSKEKSSEEDNSSEEVGKRDHTKSKNNFLTSKLPFKSSRTVNPKPFKTTAIDSKEDSSEEDNSSEEKLPTKSKNKFITSKLPFLSTANPKSYRTTDSNSEENSSEEDNSSEEKAHTKSKSKFITENSSETKDSKISSIHEMKLTTSKIQASSDDNYIKRITKEFIPATSIAFTEKQRITPSSQGSHSSESLLQSSTINSIIGTENKPDRNTVIPEVSEKDVNTNNDIEKVFRSTKMIPKEITSSAKLVSHDDLKSVVITVAPEVNEKDVDISYDTKKVIYSTEIISGETTSSAQSFSHKIVDSTTKPPVVLDLSTIQHKTTENTEIESEGPFNALCPDFDGIFPHPKNKHVFVVCVGGHPTIMNCPGNLVYDSQIAACNYEKK